MTSNLNSAAARIFHTLKSSCKTPSHVAQILAQLIVRNLWSNTTVAAAFISACNSLNLLTSAAFPLFINNLTRPHTFVCNTLLREFSHSDAPYRSPVIYSHMHRNSIPMNNYTFPPVLKAAADLKLIEGGKSVHAQVMKLGFMTDLWVGNSLMNLYAASGDMALCHKVFDEMPERDVVSWTVMVTGFKDCGRFEDALNVFEKMKSEGVMPNQVTAVNALAACAGLGALDMGIWIHEYVRKNEWELDVILGTSLINMYEKCGRIQEGLQIFHKMSQKNVMTWNAVIRGLALSKNGKGALSWFSKMQHEGIRPDQATFTIVLNACVHLGYVEKGSQIFSSLVAGKHGVHPCLEHYTCMVDLLSRANLLDDAWKMINEMPFEPCVSTYGALLAGCKAHGAFDMAEFAARKMVELQPQNGSYYVMLSNLYAEMGRWNDGEEVWELMASRGIKKCLGSSKFKIQDLDHSLEFMV